MHKWLREKPSQTFLDALGTVRDTPGRSTARPQTVLSILLSNTKPIQGIMRYGVDRPIPRFTLCMFLHGTRNLSGDLPPQLPLCSSVWRANALQINNATDLPLFRHNFPRGWMMCPGKE